MKSKQQKRNEAHERAVKNAKLSVKQKLDKAYHRAVGGSGDCKREIVRLERQLSK